MISMEWPKLLILITRFPRADSIWTILTVMRFSRVAVNTTASAIKQKATRKRKPQRAFVSALQPALQKHHKQEKATCQNIYIYKSSYQDPNDRSLAM
jgi:hypothetical protein